MKSSAPKRRFDFLNQGFSLAEMLIVVFVFTTLGLILTRSLAITLRSSRKSEDVSTVKQEVEFVLSTMERLLRNAKGLDCGTSSDWILNYLDEYGTETSFSCVGYNGNTYIASGSSNVRLTSPNITIINNNCGIFSNCSDSSVPHSVDITISAKRLGAGGGESSQVTLKTKVLLRNY